MPNPTRREFIALIGGGCLLLTLKVKHAWGQQAAVPVVGFVRSGTLPEDRVTAFRQGLRETGFIEGQNVAIEYRSDEGQTERLPLVVADLLRREVALIVGNTASALAAKAASTTVPIVFSTGGRPGQRWARRQPEPAWWQRHRNQLRLGGSWGEAAWAPA
jgi:putative ABC transport system substrate-binding protein